MPYVEKLKMIKEEKGLTNGEISTLSSIPLATITRVFNGQTPNPTFETISHIAFALGVSLDELAGLKKPDEEPIASPIENTLNSYSELLKDKDERIKELKEDKDVIRREKNKLVTTLVVLVMILLALVGVLVWFNIDVRNGNFGRFKY
jgi:transcriptional regulator with XRE-family HTH domain